MAVVRPFYGIRPVKELASKIAALPYDVMNTEEAREMAKGNEYSFLHVDKAQIDLDPSVNQYDACVYEKARDTLYKMIEDKQYIEDSKPCYYIYRQTMNGRSQTGLVSCTSIDDYINDIIKKHEFTRPEKEEDRIRHVDYCDANTGPIFLTYRENKEISEIINKWVNTETTYDFISEDGVGHTVWIIDDGKDIEKLQNLFENVDYLYIADGHHRSASAVKVGLKRREENPRYTGAEEYNYFLSIVYPDSELDVLDYNRTVKDLNGLTSSEFIEKVQEKFIIEKVEGKLNKVQEKRTFGMYLDEEWYVLKAKEGIFNPNHPIERLDVAILQNNLLAPILGIDDPRTSNRIEFIGGIRGLKELEKRANTDMKVSFAMFPTTIDDIMSVADIGEVMPPKSTWFEPKPRSGLFVHKLK